jgi:hypothetical protein
MSLRYMVIEKIKERGCGNVDHLMPELSQHGYTRKQVIQALQNAAYIGKLWTDGKSGQPGVARKDKRPSVYWPGKKPNNPYGQLVKKQKAKPERVLIASAWDWGTPQPESAWPKGWQGQVFKLAGLMDEDELEEA